jgi:hypothetical protein
VVRGLEIRQESVAAARLITKALGISNVIYSEADLQRMTHDDLLCADLVLVYGLIYHLENPIHTLRLAAGLSVNTYRSRHWSSLTTFRAGLRTDTTNSNARSKASSAPRPTTPKRGRRVARKTGWCAVS